MEDYLKVIVPHLDPRLVPRNALSRIQNLARRLPATSVAGFECRLREDQAQVDFQLHAPSPDQANRKWALHESTWRLLKDLWENWARSRSLPDNVIEDIVLEFDMIEFRANAKIPCIFVGLNVSSLFDTENTQTDAIDSALPFHPECGGVGGTERVSEWLVALAERLCDREISSDLKSNLRRCAYHLPSGACFSHLGAMVSRPDHAVRVNVRGISPDDLQAYLRLVGWAYSGSELSLLVSSLNEFVDYIVICLDIGDFIYPKIGIECFINAQPLQDQRWCLFTDYLVKGGHCAPAKQDAILNWTGISPKAPNSKLWPTNISLVDDLLGSRAMSLFWRSLNHVKLVHQPGTPLEAKAYLAFGHHWFDADCLKTAKRDDNLI